MPADIAVYISLASAIIALVSLLRNSRKDGRQDAASDAATNARIEAKLDGIQSGVDDLRVEMRTTRAKVDDHAERLAKVEARSASNTHRLDALEKRQHHPPDEVS